MIDINKKYKTKNGDNVTILKTDLRGNYPVVGIIYYEDCDRIETWTSEGELYLNEESGNYLIEVFEEIEYNVYWSNDIGQYKIFPNNYKVSPFFQFIKTIKLPKP